MKKNHQLESKFNDIRNLEKFSSISYFPEELSRKSPITIINAPWGSGKTYFIEKFCDNFAKRKIKNDYFKRVIILDVWKFSNSNSIPEELMSEIMKIFYETYQDKKVKESIIKISKILFNTTLNPWIKKFTGIKINDLKEKINIEKELKSINKKIEKTIIFLDNIERLGRDAWEILKALLKFTQFENLILVLPMNMKRIADSDYDSSEYKIEKYIDIGFFNLKQDYSSFLKDQEFDDETIKIINKLLNEEIEGQKLSIRELEQRFRFNDIQKYKDDEYKLIEEILKKIWGSIDAVKELLRDKIEYYLTSLEKINENFKELKNYLNDDFFEKTNEINQILDEIHSLNINVSFLQSDNTCKKVELFIKKTNMFYTETKNSIQILNSNIEEKEDQIKKLQSQIKKLYFKISKEEEMENFAEKNSSNIVNWRNEIEIKQDDIIKNKDIINDNEEQITNSESLIESINLKIIEIIKAYNDKHESLLKEVREETDEEIWRESAEMEYSIDKELFIEELTQKIIENIYKL